MTRTAQSRTASHVPDAETDRMAEVLRFWRDVEVFTVPGAPRLGKGPSRHVACYTDADSLPWAPDSPLAPMATGEMVLTHAVFVGVAPKSAWARQVLAVACPGHKLTPTEFEQLAGDGWLAGFVVGPEGFAQAGSYVPASFALGVERLRQGLRLEGLREAIDKAAAGFAARHSASGPQGSGTTPQPAQARDDAAAVTSALDVDAAFEGGEDAAAALTETPGIDGDDGIDDTPRPVCFADLLRECDIALQAVGSPDIGAPYRVVIASSLRRRRPKHKPHDKQVDLAFLNSFYLNDLDSLLDAAPREGFQSPALAQFLCPAPDMNARRDVLEDKALLAALAGPDKMLSGRWPASSHMPLMLAQQAAVGAIVDRLSSTPGLMAVNGPPGTGKTTLLCDIVADVVVKRGRALSQVGAPWRAFGTKATAGGMPIYPLEADIAAHTGIVVASNNNAAVENITRALPATDKIDTAEHPDAAYLTQVAANVFAIAGIDAPSWGLVAAPLGNSDNRYKFSQAYFRDGKQQGADAIASDAADLKAVLETPPQDALARWHTARHAFTTCDAEVERLRGVLVRAQAALEAQGAAQEASAQRLALRARLKAELEALAGGDKQKRRTLTMQLASLTDAQARIDDAQAKGRADVAALKALGSVPADAAFFRASADTQHLISLWVHPALDLARAKLFLAALHLHEATLLACNGKSIANARAVRAMLARDTPDPIAPEERQMVWDFLFFCVPVVSSTLASFDRLFEGVAPASLGWLLIDEAGQATPQSVVGALWRSRRAVIIGDPLQVPPVMTAPHALVQELLRKHPIDACFSPMGASAQTLADRTSDLGAFIDTYACERVWTGLPLRAHRRCIDPMFSIANRIAYAGQMVQANANPAEIDCSLGPSAWFDVRGTSAEHQLVHEEMALLSDLIWQVQMDWPRLDSGERARVFIVSPFRRIADAARTLLRTADLVHAHTPIDSGTVHRFQGREADIVLLVLGSAPGPEGAGSRHWASHRPNLLNVAVTRARLRLYVIGSVADWQSCRHFDVLAELMHKQGDIVRAAEQVER